jgi:methylated-DNA-[protein]-cysteine S-methyltransferase
MIHTKTTIWWTQLSMPFFQHRPFYIAATEQGLLAVQWPDEPFVSLQHWATKHISDAEWVEDPQRLSDYVEQLQQYLHGERQHFTLPLDLRGTPFRQRVWQALQQIPFGETCSYADIAALIGQPSAVRAVGGALGANPVPLVVPCHRVIGKNGTLTGFGGGLPRKRQLLQLEGYTELK